jgi:glutamate decarboxylase
VLQASRCNNNKIIFYQLEFSLAHDAFINEGGKRPLGRQRQSQERMRMIGQNLRKVTKRLALSTAIPPAVNHELPDVGRAAGTAYRQIHHELAGDGAPRRNLASFVTTKMDAQADRLALESIGKNLINSAEYPSTEIIHQRVVRIIANLFHAELPPEDGAEDAGFIGTTTVGSSEAMMLALLAHKWNWRKQHRQSPYASHKDRPYLVIGTHTHACFTKFARYFDVNVKWVPLAPGQYSITAEQIRAVLETRIGDDPQVMRECGFTVEEAGARKVGDLVMAIGCVLGTTYTGALDDVAGIDRVLAEGGWGIPIHVDAASGGFVLPFTQPELRWDFSLPHVQSINVSNHKFGMVYAGLGTLVFRNAAVVPEELLVDVHYLSGEMRNFGLNFSRASNGVVMQYFNFLHLGHSGYRHVISECLANAQFLAESLDSQSGFEVVSDTEQMPVVAVRLRTDSPRFSLSALAEGLKRRGWIVPVYHLPANVEEVEVMRIVVKPEFTRAEAKAFLHDLLAAIEELTAAPHTSAVSQFVDALRMRCSTPEVEVLS